MRLTAIKLAGFKSFVDSTTFRAPTNLTGVVGPNGCGKSNIIDACRWVMGEGSAKVLRGEQMADVIFSGSSARKPVGTATVELVFDNSEGRVSGEYAGYNEISVKRQVSRDGISQYSLNGTRCRRKDITDLFLGTGLGPRSYSIVEQGMISQIVEARPEEIRGHLEEAAGISKYKERRRETERRIKHTRENLDRLSDLRDEVGNHLSRLKRQAKAAERYKKLKGEKRDKESRLLALQWRQLHQDAEAGRAALAGQEAGLEERIAIQRKAEAALEKIRQEQSGATEAVNKAQGAVYSAGSDIARLEQTIQHARDLQTRRRQEHEETESSLKDLEQHMVLDRAQMADLATSLAEVEPALEKAQTVEVAAGVKASEVDAQVQSWQDRLEKHHGLAATEHRKADGLRARVEVLEKRVSDALERRKVLDSESAELQSEGVPGDLAEFELNAKQTGKAEKGSEAALEKSRQIRDAAQLATREAVNAEHSVDRELNGASGRLESLKAMQAASPGGKKATQWLTEHGLGEAQRLASGLDVDDGWQTAVETVLGHWLDAVLVDDVASLAGELSGLQAAAVTLIKSDEGARVAKGSLASRARAPGAVLALLSSVRVADSVEDAQTILKGLNQTESVITADGTWFGPGWVRVARGGGILVRERDIRVLQERVDSLEAELSKLRQARLDASAAQESAEQEFVASQDRLNEAHRERTAAIGVLEGHRQRAGDLERRQAQIATEVVQIDERQSADRESLKAARKELESVLEGMAGLETQRTELDASRRELLEQRSAARADLKEARDSRHELALKAESSRASRESLQSALERMDTQVSQLQQRFMSLAEQLARDEDPEAAHRAEMDALLANKTQAEQGLNSARTKLESLDADYREQDGARQAAAHESDELRGDLERARLGQQELELNARNLERQVAALDQDVEAVARDLPEEADPATWIEELEKLALRIQRMEPVNLAAIQEFEEEQKRKEYLDAQNEDLCEALATLESAIARIDRRTRTRFKDTFERVNKGVQELFPRLFGGGHAYLELTGEDLLTTGVSIMARPPGKRVSSIHLLSGGEKALTAVAFVFAIFQLNPAPFCMLDEVDAPLDDANVGRFSEMVREMSETVQFVMVTHNKITMEMVHQLSGVTMREPGVSRLVQVDVAEAVQLAEA